MIAISLSVFVIAAILLRLYLWIVDRIDLPFALRIVLLLFFYIPLPLLLYGSFARHETLIGYGTWWLIWVEAAFVMVFFETGMSRLFPGLTRVWMLTAAALSGVLTWKILRNGFPMVGIQGLNESVLFLAFSLGLFYLVFLRLRKRLELNHKTQGALILVLWGIAFSQLVLSGSTAIIVFIWFYYFIFSRISGGLDLGRRGNFLLISVLLGLFILSYQQISFSGDILNSRAVYLAGGISLGVVAISFSFLIFEAELSFFLRSARKYITIFFVILIVAVSVFSAVNGLSMPEVVEIHLPEPKLPDDVEEFTIVHLSDTHLGPLLPISWFNEVVDTVNRLEPDIVVITGDIFERDFDDPEGFASAVSRINAPHGIYGVTGNHEYYYGLERFKARIKDANIRILGNESVTAGGIVEIAGIDDRQGAYTENGGSDLDSALGQTDGNLPVILLSHRPDIFTQSSEKGIDLQLSGHTHAGQIPPLSVIVMFYYEYPYGLYERNGSYLYTSSGTGCWGTPMRLFNSHEIVKIVLENR